MGRANERDCVRLPKLTSIGLETQADPEIGFGVTFRKRPWWATNIGMCMPPDRPGAGATGPVLGAGRLAAFSARRWCACTN